MKSNPFALLRVIIAVFDFLTGSGSWYVIKFQFGAIALLILAPNNTARCHFLKVM